MTYPTTAPKAKHDVVSVHPLSDSGSTLASEMGFSSTQDLFRKLEEDQPSSLSPICSSYSYSDAPDYPGPLSRSLVILGVADRSLSLVRKIVSDDQTVPDCMHKCTIAVQLADAKHMPRLPPKHQTNSTTFAGLMKRLRREEAVAIVGKDKYERFGILVPMGEPSPADEDASQINPEDCAAYCFVGEVKDVLAYLTNSSGGETTAEPQEVAEPSANLWQPPGTDTGSDSAGIWQPPGTEEGDTGNSFSAPWASNQEETSNAGGWESTPWEASNSGTKRSFETMNEGGEEDETNNDTGETFHADAGAAAADAFYSGLTRSLDTRADSHLYHMRSFNGWVKATQIQELDPRTQVRGGRGNSALRILDLACGKGGDLTKWSLHARGIRWYVGIDVARGSLKDAAIRAREMRKRNKLPQAIFTVADLGADVPGRKKSPHHKNMQALLTWSLADEDVNESAAPEFKRKRGGGISETDRFDVVSIQFAIHYMMSTRERARRFFHTVSELLEIGGNLICTTIDARVVIGHLMNLGLNLHLENGEKPEFSEAVVQAGAGACKITFEPEMVKRIVSSMSDGKAAEEDLFGLQYTFTLVEGSDHAKGVGDAVNLPEWLTPLPVLEALAQEAGLVLDYAQNFHEFYEARKDASANPAAHLALYNMKVLNREGSISSEEWSVSRLYAAIRFRKERESTIVLNEEEDEAEQEEDAAEEAPPERQPVELDPIKAKTMLPMAMMKAKRAAGEDTWKGLSSDEKKQLTQLQLEILAKK